MKTLRRIRASILLLLALVGAHLFAVAQEGSSSSEKSRLICGTDESGFNGMDGQLAEVRTDGPSLVSAVQLYNLSVPVNGITFASTLSLPNAATSKWSASREVCITRTTAMLSSD